jgi:hypothetical protein
MTTLDPDRRASLLAGRLRALVAARWGVPDGALAGTSAVGASLTDREGGRTWVLVDDDPARRLGMALALALRGGDTDRPNLLHLIVDERGTRAEAGAEAAGILARRATQLATPVEVWRAVGPDLVPVVPSAPATDPPPPPGAELYRPVLAAAGLEPVVEGGELIGELLGLEVARVVVGADGEAHVEAGVGRFDREAGAMMFAHLGETDALARAVDVVRRQRRSGTEHHPLNQMVPERWLRAVLVARPALVGAARLHPVGSACPRRNLRENGVATAVGTGLDGEPVVVTCSTGVDLDLVPSAADDRLTHAPGARLVLAVPADDALGITADLAALLVDGAELVTVPDDWRSLSTAADG